MKKPLFFMALCATTVFVSCSKTTTINDDPIIGIWTNTIELNSSTTEKTSETEYEWIFNDAYLGRYHEYSDDVLIMQTDFSWSIENGLYTIQYPGTDLPEETATLIESSTLQDSDGEILATRE
ncbi:hypothetical protein KO500_11055 [Cellulophaga baltica]|uniref:hypothetical protein n=1 Tax=Cellulophaga TaxID=104264 RepID=UPI001C07A379|nr:MULTISPECIES: hypothetical protein [Cellulophaga]MBU2996976.1 hypothetical protein [Cellulophaga baltica]MDO6768374.1 hypothetical protein [Cellulophaga sp. 1_MG-2023]